MFKFKMSLLLKSAKFKVVMVAILIAAIAAGIIFMPKNKAGNVSQQVTVKANKTGITVGGQQVYSIVKDGKATGYDKLYCIESGEDLSYSTFSSPIELSKAGNYFSDYNKAMWIINNMYITTITGQNGLDNETAKQIAIMNLANIATTDSVKQKVKAKTGVDYSGVTVQKIYNLRNKTIGKTATVNAIETIEQFALWKYTKNLNTKALDAYEKNPSQYLDGASLSNDEQITLKYLFYALGVLADNNASTSANTVSLNKSGANFDENNHQVGPYYLESNGTKLTSYSFGDLGNASYPIEITITKSDDTTVNAGAEIITKNADGSFYINLNSYQDAKKVNLKINYVLNNVSTTGYVLDGGTKQNILSVEKTVGVTSATDEKEIKVKTPTGTFTVELKKVKEDGTTVITSSEAEFKINGETKNTSKGILSIAQNQKIENEQQTNSYEIIETKAPEGFEKFEGTLNLSLGFKKDGDNFVIDESKVKSEGFKDKTRVEVSQDKTKITVFVVNKERKTGTYTVELRKVKEDGTTVITSSEAEFKINGETKNTTNGILNIAQSKNIEKVEQVDNYEINETKAPDGFEKFEGTLKLSVGFKLEGSKFIIDESKVKSEGFKDKTRVEVSQDKTKITVFVVNKERKTGTYTVELRKVKEDGTTVITSSEAEFKINGETKNTTNGILNIAQSKNIEKVEQVDNYEIVETKAPDGFREFDGTLKLSVGFKLEGNKFIIDESKVKSEGFNDKTRVEVSQDKTKITVFVVNTQKEFDLSLRKFISKINGNKVEPSREPVINENSIKMLEKTGTASYYHTKKSIVVNVGDEVEYTIRVYNEGEILGYAKQVTDYLPEGLSFVKLSEDTAKEYTTDSKAGSKIVVINYSGNTVIKTLRDFIGKKVNVTNEYYQEMKMICKVENTEKVYITNRAEITNYGYESKNKNGEIVWNEAKAIKNVDRDSVQNTIKDELNLDTWYENAKESRYIGEETKQDVVDKNYYPGTQDDDDFETVEVLTGKYNVIIKKVDAEDKSKTLAGAYFTISQTSEKAVPVKKGPTDSNGEVTLISGKQIKTDKQVDDYNIYEVEAPEGYNKYNDQIKLTVHTKMEGKNFVIDSQNTKVDGKNVELQVNENTIIITVPNNKKEFDLSLRKFITQINDKEITSRIPKVDTSKLATGESKTATYNHPKDPLDVNPSDIVTYTIRVYNEGEVSGYATKIMDDIPEGLEFVPGTFDKEGKATNTNAKYGWKIYKKVTQPIEAFIKENVITYNNEKYVVTDDVKEADLIVTDYLSKENGENNLIKAFDPKTMKELDYRDVKVSFKVVEAKTSDRILINYAQITEHEDSNGDKIKDRDSTPNEWIETDDDQDIEKIKLRYFDLSLLKWVTKAIVYENGQKTVTETGHTGYENPEPVVKVDLKNTSLNNVEVKFEYKIRITNEGDIAGYAKEISDYIPQGLKFVASDNPQWRETDGKIVTRALENTLLQPGETADVTVILTWINGADNLGLKTNIAEISEDYNDYGTPDIDSTPNNRVPDEDDIDDAPVMLSIRTGSSNIIYASIVAGVLAIISLGVIVIKKNILK